ncbi:hypothetical protein TKK_0013229 [Trichogramma kaykai]|uniref:PRANC domain-containing protein n=1 Tax=Trichogramma kaykai TaxID=54128 RepID=A0ABD2WKB3_9HYME
MSDDDFDSDDSSDFDYFFGYESNESDSDDNFDTGEEKLEKLKSLREKVNWVVDEERREFLRQLQPIIKNWIDGLPDLRDIFRGEEIDWLLSESVKNENQNSSELVHFKGVPFVNFVIATGYKDEPDVDKDGNPILHRTTAVHIADKCTYPGVVRNVFEIYDRFDINYTDEFGLTHFHAACKSGCIEVAEKFLELGQDPNLLVPETDDSPLHLALANGRNLVVQLLLRNGADPNLTNAKGHTPLHLICKQEYLNDCSELFFEIIDEQHQTVQVNARDNLGRTPLEWAVANLLPNVIDVLLDHGADLSSFVFPSENHFNESPYENLSCKLDPASGKLAVVEHLKKRGYELDRSDAMTVMKFFAKYELFEDTSLLEKFPNDDKYAKRSKKLLIRDQDPILSLYDLMRLQPEEASKILTYTDYYDFATSDECYERVDEASTLHLGEIMSRGFFQRWALEPLLELTARYQLPVLCCEIIIKKLKNKDLFNICLAATGQNWN